MKKQWFGRQKCFIFHEFSLVLPYLIFTYFIAEFMEILAVFLSTFSYVTTTEINEFWTYQCREMISSITVESGRAEW